MNRQEAIKVWSENERSRGMRNFNWWLGSKHRVRKKYKLLLGRYYSPKEIKKWYKDFKKGQSNARKKR